MIESLPDFGGYGSSELSRGLHDAVEQVLRDNPQQAELDRALARATAARPSGRRPPRRLFVYQVLSASAAASLIVACVVALTSPRSSHAWEGIVETVKTKPWIHLTINRSSASAEGQMWISIENRVFAEKSDRRTLLGNLETGEAVRYDGADDSIQRVSLGEDELQRFTLFRLLFEATTSDAEEVKLAGTAAIRITGRKSRSVTIQGRDWTVYEFAFEHEYDRGVTKERMSFFVDREKQLPLRIDYQVLDHGGKVSGEESVMDVDYPDTGPATIYDLGAPRTAKLPAIEPAE